MRYFRSEATLPQVRESLTAYSQPLQAVTVVIRFSKVGRVDDLFGKMAVSRHVSLILCSIQNYGELGNPSYVLCLFTFFAALRRGHVLLLVAIHSTTYW